MNAITKKLLSFVIVLAMVLSMTPVITLPAAAAEEVSVSVVNQWITDNDSAFKAAEANKDAVSAPCPFCGEDNVSWAAVASTTTDKLIVAASGAKHFYLSESFEYAKSNVIYASYSSGKGIQPCVYLNGKTLTLTLGTNLVAAGLNLIGGKVNADGTTDTENCGKIIRKDGSATNGLFRTATGTSNSTNIYGGIYEDYDEDAYLFRDGISMIWNLYGATFESKGEAAHDLILHTKGTLNLHSGTINCGTSSFDVEKGTVNLLGGTFNGALNMDTGALTIGGTATVNGNVEVAADATLTLSGTPIINRGTGDGLTVSAPANIAGLTGGSIDVSGNVEMVIANADIDGKETYFKAPDSYEVVAEGGALVVKVQQGVKNEPEVGVFAPDLCEGYAYCPACMAQGVNDQPVLWEAYNGQHISDETALNAGEHKHYYLTGNQNYETTYFYYSKSNSCFNLNGFNVTGDVNNTTAFSTTAKLNIVDTEGGSVVTGRGAAVSGVGGGSAVNLNSAAADVHLYGGTYTRTSGYATVSVISVREGGGTVTAYEGVTINGNVASNRNGGSVFLLGSDADADAGTPACPAVFNLKGGTIIGYASNATTTTGTHGSSIAVGGRDYNTPNTNAVFNLHSGDIYGGGYTVTNRYGGNIAVRDGNVLNMYGGNIYGGNANQGGEVYIYGGSTFNMYGGNIYGDYNKATGTGTDSVRIAADSTMNMSGGTITAAAANTYAVAVANDATVNMSGESKIQGNSKNRSAMVIMGANVTLSGNASILPAANTKNVALWINSSSANQVNIDTSWTGTVYAQFAKDSSTNVGELGETAVKVNWGTMGESFEVGEGAAPQGTLFESNTTDAQVFPVADGDWQVAAGAVVNGETKTWHKTAQDAVNAAENNALLYLVGEANLSGKTIMLDMGESGDVTLSGSGTVYGIDTANKANLSTHGATLTVNGADITVNNIAQDGSDRYVSMKDPVEAKYTFHYFNLRLSAVSLRAKANDENGLYYKAQITMDDELANALGSYGVALSLADMPNAGFMNDPDTSFTEITDGLTVNADNDYTVTTTSGGVIGIMKESYDQRPDGYATDADYNAYRGTWGIYANAYLYFDFDGEGDYDDGEFIMSQIDTEVKYSMHDAMEAIDGDAEKHDVYDKNADKINAFYTYWLDKGMSEWTFDNIHVNAEV